MVEIFHHEKTNKSKHLKECIQLFCFSIYSLENIFLVRVKLKYQGALVDYHLARFLIFSFFLGNFYSRKMPRLYLYMWAHREYINRRIELDVPIGERNQSAHPVSCVYRHSRWIIQWMNNTRDRSIDVVSPPQVEFPLNCERILIYSAQLSLNSRNKKPESPDNQWLLQLVDLKVFFFLQTTPSIKRVKTSKLDCIDADSSSFAELINFWVNDDLHYHSN